MPYIVTVPRSHREIPNPCARVGKFYKKLNIFMDADELGKWQYIDC